MLASFIFFKFFKLNKLNIKIKIFFLTNNATEKPYFNYNKNSPKLTLKQIC